MARKRKYAVSAVNVALHKHSPKLYVELFKALGSSNIEAQFRGDTYAMLSECRPIITQEKYVGLRGTIFRSTKINPNGMWFDTITKTAVDPDDLENLSLPDGYNANLEFSRFFFVLDGHTFYFEVDTEDGYHFGSRTVAKWLKTLCGHPDILKQFGPIDVTALPVVDSLDRLLDLERITQLDVEITWPNSDVPDEEKIRNRLKNQNASRLRQSLKSEKGKSLVPDEETTSLAKIASTNGKVEVIGYDDSGERQERSTVQYPWIESRRYDPDVEQPGQMFPEIVESMEHERRGE